MVNRLVKIAALTGAAHIFTIIALKFLSKWITTEEISSLGEIDALFQFIINTIGFGLQLSAIRDIASSENWYEIYSQTQMARNTLGILLMFAATLYFFNSSYQYFILAPIFALSGDYALYGRSKPVFAATLAFCRVFIPSLTLMVFSFWRQDDVLPAYVISTAAIYFITSIIIANRLNSPYWFRPNFKSLQLYAKSFYLGIATIANYIIGLGLIIVAAFFYTDTIIAISYLALKLYMIYKGVIRIINQAFIKEMLSDMVCIKVDQLACITGLGFFSLLSIFPKSFISVFFNEQFGQHQLFLTLVSAASMIASFLTSLTTRSILKRKDKAFAKYSALAVIVSIAVLIILSFFYQSALNIGVSLLMGEAIITWGLYKINTDIRISDRVYFLLQSSLLLLFPLTARIIAGDEIVPLVVSMAIFALGGALLIHKKFLSMQTV